MYPDSNCEVVEYNLKNISEFEVEGEVPVEYWEFETEDRVWAFEGHVVFGAYYVSSDAPTRTDPGWRFDFAHAVSGARGVVHVTENDAETYTRELREEDADMFYHLWEDLDEAAFETLHRVLEAAVADRDPF